MSSQDPEAYIQEDWDYFRNLDQMTNHWDRPGWTPGRRSFHWMLTLGADSALRKLAEQCQQALQGIPTLDLVPLDWLHLTLQRVAFTDEIAEEELEAVTSAVRKRLATVPTFAMDVGPLAGSPGAIRFSVGPQERLRTVHAAVCEGIAEGRGLLGLPAAGSGAGFRPHVSIAYSNAVMPVAGLARAVAGLRQLPRVRVAVDAVALVELRRVGASYRWGVVASVGLGESVVGQ